MRLGEFAPNLIGLQAQVDATTSLRHEVVPHDTTDAPLPVNGSVRKESGR